MPAAMQAGRHAVSMPTTSSFGEQRYGRRSLAAAAKRNDPNPHASFTRTWVHSVAKTVNILRNRVAHHEPLHNGFPLPGQRSGQQQTTSRRLTAAEGVEAYMKLTRMIDRDLAEWITHHTQVTAVLASRPR